MASHFRPRLLHFVHSLLFLSLIFWSGYALAEAQQGEGGTLSGQVTDSDGGPLPGVTVTADGESGIKTTYTDNAGKFEFSLLPMGLYDVTVELGGFITITKTDVDVKTGANELSFMMQPGGLAELMVVTASKVETQLINAPATLSVVSSQTIESSPAQNYADLLRSVPGLNVTQTSNRDINLTSRQANSTLATSQLALLDGRTIYLDFFGFIGWDFLPVNFDEIKQIEVIRGPASAVWGANAQTGVVNIITKSPREQTGTVVTLNAGRFERDVEGGPEIDAGHTFGANVRYAQIINDKWAYKLSGGYYDSEPWARPSGTIPLFIYPDDESRPVPASNPLACLAPGAICTGGNPYSLTAYENQDSSQPKFDVRFDQEIDEDTRLIYAGGVAGTDGIIHTGIGPFDIQSGTVLGYGKVNYNRNNMKFNFFVNILDGDAINQFGATDATTGQPVDLIFKNQTYDIEFADSRIFADRHILSYGGNYRRNNFEISIAPDAEDRNEVGGYIQDEFFTDKIRIVAGVRVDKFSVIDNAVASPRVTFMYKPMPEHAFRASYNRAFRSPSAINNFLNTTIINVVDLSRLPSPPFPPGLPGLFLFPITALGNEPRGAELKEEELNAFEVGYTGEFQGKTTVGVSYYINNQDDSINFTAFQFYSPQNPPPGTCTALPAPVCAAIAAGLGFANLPAQYTYLNLGPLRQQGIEVSLDQIVTSSLSFNANYSYQKDPEIQDDENPYPLIEVIWPPHHRFNAGVNFASRRWLGSFSVNYQSDAFWTDVLDSRFFGPTEAFTQVNAAFGVKWMDGRVVTTLKVTNLTNEDIHQHVFGDILKRSIVGEVKFNL